MLELDQNLLIMVGILVAVLLLSIIGLMSRYRKCKSSEALVVYGKTGKKHTSKIVIGGGVFVWPIIQAYSKLSLTPIQIRCDLNKAISKGDIRVSVPTVVTVAISTDDNIIQNAATRLLGLPVQEQEEIVRDIVFGQLRIAIANMTISEINQDRDKFASKIHENLVEELNKIGFEITNVNIIDVYDESKIIENRGKAEEAKALNEAKAEVATQERIGAIKVAEEIKLRDTEKSKADQERDIKLAEIARDREIAIETANKDKEIQVSKNVTESQSVQAELNAQMEIRKADALRNSQIGNNNARIEIAKSDALLAEAEAEKSKRAGSARVIAEAEIERKHEEQLKEVEKAKALRKSEELNANEIVPTEIAKKKAILEAEAASESARTQARGEADAVIMKAEAEAEAIRKKKLAEAEGIRAAALAEAEGFQAMMDAAAANQEVAIQWKMVDQWEKVAAQYGDAVKHLNLGEIKVYGGSETAGSFIENTIKKVAPIFDMLRSMPLPEKVAKALDEGDNDVSVENPKTPVSPTPEQTEDVKFEEVGNRKRETGVKPVKGRKSAK